MRSLLTLILLAAAMLPALSQAQPVNICDRTPPVRDDIMQALEADDCAAVDSQELAYISVLIPNAFAYETATLHLQAGDFDGLTRLFRLELSQGFQLTTLPVGIFDNLARLQELNLYGNQLTTLPVGIFDDLARLQILNLRQNQLTTLPAGVFDGLARLQDLRLNENQLTELPVSVFAGLGSLQILNLDGNQLTGLPVGIFDDLRSLQELNLYGNQLTTLPAGVFDSLTRLQGLGLYGNQLTTLPAGVFDNLARLQGLGLGGNQLTTLPAGVFDSLTRLQTLTLHDNQLTTLPAGVFDNLTSLQTLHLYNNHLVGLTRESPLFAALPNNVFLRLDGQTEPPGQPPTRLDAAVPLMVSASDSMRQGFVRIINESEESGSVRILSFDDGGTAAEPIEIQLGANQALHFNSNDLENGNARKGINAGVGSPMRGDWRLDIETTLLVRVQSFVRTTDGFLTAMGEVLPRGADGRLAAHVFNPGSNMDQESKLRLVNTGANAEGVSIEGVDDQGGRGGPVTLTLAAGESRTLSAFDLEEGAQGLTGTLGDGAGKWRLFITTGQAVVGMSLLEAVTGHLTNISAMGVATEGQR